jgi:RAP1 GTPase activating protein 1
MGETITLKGYSGYTGGLDTKSDTTGTKSVCTKFRGYSVMYHVVPHLPYFPKDQQQVKKKKKFFLY